MDRSLPAPGGGRFPIPYGRSGVRIGQPTSKETSAHRAVVAPESGTVARMTVALQGEP